jgi:uncharacterized protein DUF5663
MINLDAALLREVGLDELRADLSRLALSTIYDVLEIRVGFRLAHRMSAEQLKEFEYFIKVFDKDAQLTWLTRNMPDYKDVVAEVFEELKAEIVRTASDVMMNVAALLAETPDRSALPH